MTRSNRGLEGAPRIRKGGNSEHDHGYKLLFSQPLLVEELVRGFLPGPWVDRLDFTSLQKAGSSVITDDLRERHDDVIWKVRWRDGHEEHWFWIYLLLELQSTPDPFMAVRMLTYVGLLLQELIREKKLEPGRLLPPVLPVVLYHGKPRWRTSLHLSGLFAPAPEEVKGHLPQIRYRLLDAGQLPLHHPDLRDNLVAALLRLETTEAREAAARVRELDLLVPAGEKELRRILDIWLARLFRRFPFSATIFKGKINLGSATMLEETFRDWERKIRQESLREGRREGRQEGRQEGQIEGLQKAILEMLRQRFGPVPQAVRQHVREMSSASDLTKLTRRILTASSLQETGLL
ncbi:MAG TPA: Rpn family recombination-promoting nuclease/putative transposase [Thermoanaerobaculia bacterium]|nr:Rpn family recombination-promoting nuclease/putative transposase [Thermoanaerobaculia bacterium]